LHFSCRGKKKEGAFWAPYFSQIFGEILKNGDFYPFSGNFNFLPFRGLFLAFPGRGFLEEIFWRFLLQKISIGKVSSRLLAHYLHKLHIIYITTEDTSRSSLLYSKLGARTGYWYLSDNSPLNQNFATLSELSGVLGHNWHTPSILSGVQKLFPLLGAIARQMCAIYVGRVAKN
jgi:hypothetical protein